MKTLTKKTYALPSDVVEEFEKHVAPGKRGAVLGQIVRAYLEEKRREELRARIEEGLADKENEALYLEVEREWAPVSDEVWRAIDDDLWEWDEPQPNPQPEVQAKEGGAA